MEWKQILKGQNEVALAGADQAVKDTRALLRLKGLAHLRLAY